MKNQFMGIVSRIFLNIGEFVLRYGKMGLIPAILCGGITYLAGRKLQKPFQESMGKATLLGLFAFYISMVLSITLLSRNENPDPVLNLIPFSTYSDTLWSRIFLFENILLFLPCSALLYPMAKPFQKPVISMLTGFFFSLSIETAQYFTGRGRFEADDILTNLTGMLLGYCLAAGIQKCRKTETH